MGNGCDCNGQHEHGEGPCGEDCQCTRSLVKKKGPCPARIFNNRGGNSAILHTKKTHAGNPGLGHTPPDGHLKKPGDYLDTPSGPKPIVGLIVVDGDKIEPFSGQGVA